MKRRLPILNLLFALALIGAVAAQSVHNIGHYLEEQAERHCVHESYSKASLTHTHAELHHCFICDFTLSPVADFNVWTIEAVPVAAFVERFVAFQNPLYLSSVSGCPTLRGPPSMMI